MIVYLPRHVTFNMVFFLLRALRRCRVMAFDKRGHYEKVVDMGLRPVIVAKRVQTPHSFEMCNKLVESAKCSYFR